MERRTMPRMAISRRNSTLRRRLCLLPILLFCVLSAGACDAQNAALRGADGDERLEIEAVDGDEDADADLRQGESTCEEEGREGADREAEIQEPPTDGDTETLDADTENASDDDDQDAEPLDREKEFDWIVGEHEDPDHERLDPDPDWDRGWESEAALPQDPAPPYILSRMFLPQWANGGLRGLPDSRGMIAVFGSRLVAIDPDLNTRWIFPPFNYNDIAFQRCYSSGSDSFCAFLGQGRDETLYVLNYYDASTSTAPYHGSEYTYRILKVSPIDGTIGEMVELADVFAFSAICRNFTKKIMDDYYPPPYKGWVEGDWLYLYGVDPCRDPDVPIAHYQVFGIHLPDMEMKWRYELSQGYSSGPRFSYPDGSVGVVSDFTNTQIFFLRFSPFGELLSSEPFTFTFGADQTVVFPYNTLSDGSLVFGYELGLFSFYPNGQPRWKRDFRAGPRTQMVLAVDRDDTTLLTDGWVRLAHFAADGSYLYHSGGFEAPLDGVAVLPAGSFWRWMVSSSAGLQLHTPFNDPPESYPDQAVCGGDLHRLDPLVEPAEEPSDTWTLAQPASAAQVVCPELPEIPSPYSAKNYTAYADPSLAKAWIGNRDALWRYDLPTQTARCLHIGKVDALSGFLAADKTVRLVFAVGRALYSGPEAGPYTVRLLPGPLEAALSLATDGVQVAVGGPQGLWLATLAGGEWRAVGECCGSAPEIGHGALRFESGSLWVGGKGVWRVSPDDASCHPLCPALTADDRYEVYGRSARGVWAGRKRARDTSSAEAARVSEVGECLDNGLWLHHATPEGIAGAIPDGSSGLVAVQTEFYAQGGLWGYLVECGINVRALSVPGPLAHSARINLDFYTNTLGADGVCPFSYPPGSQLVRTADGLFFANRFLTLAPGTLR